jgi:hypothetical protein
MGDGTVRLFRTKAEEEVTVPEARETCERVCLLCNGPLERLKGQVRCQVCQFTFCDGCDGAPDERLFV